MQEIELLTSCFQITQMGRDAVMQLIKIAEDSKFRKALENQLTEYQHIFDKAQEMLNARGATPKEISAMAKMAASTSTKMKTLGDKTASNMAELMIEGNTMGIIEITKSLHRCDQVDQDVLDFANHLLDVQRKNVDEMTTFL